VLKNDLKLKLNAHRCDPIRSDPTDNRVGVRWQFCQSSIFGKIHCVSKTALM